MFDSLGVAVDSTGSYPRLQSDVQLQYFSNIITSIKAYREGQKQERGKTRLLFFVHGGLNNRQMAVERADGFSF